MRSAILRATIFVVLCPIISMASGNEAIPDAPSSSLMPVNAALEISVTPNNYAEGVTAPVRARVVDKQFLFLSTVATATIFADSYTTTWIGENYRARRFGACTVEGGEPLLYGVHPTVGRSYAVAAGMSAGAIAVSYMAKKHLPSRLKWMWPSALLYETTASVHGVTTNLSRCNP